MVEIPDYQVRLSYGRVQRWVNLRTPNLETATARAIKADRFLRVNGWDEMYIQAGLKSSKKMTSPNKVTVGEFLKRVSESAGLKDTTFLVYARSFRQIVSEIKKIPSGNGKTSKYSYQTDGYRDWLEAVERIQLREITPEKVQRWKISYVNRAGKSPAKRESASASVNKLLRNAKALFSEKTTRFTELTLPMPLPFEGIAFEKEGSKRYESRFDAKQLILQANHELNVPIPEVIDRKAVRAARDAHSKACKDHGKTAFEAKEAARKVWETEHAIELAQSKNEQFKILLLALVAGLRRGEIDYLEWESVDFATSSIRIKATDYFEAKSRDSYRRIPVESELIDALRSFRPANLSDPRPKSIFVINSAVSPEKTAFEERYRCDRHFKRLTDWLREKGIETVKPIHTLRKEYGSCVNARGGIFQASRNLGHSSVQVTERYYAADLVTTTSGLGEVLSTSEDHGLRAVGAEDGV